MDMIGRESTEVMNKIKQIVMFGRQMGFYIILSGQRSGAKYLGNGVISEFIRQLFLKIRLFVDNIQRIYENREVD